MDSQEKIKRTPMQHLKDVINETKDILSKKDEYSDFDFRIHLDAVINLLDNHFSLEALRLSDAFDYGFLQAELKEMAEITNGDEYVKKFFKKDENIPSKI